MIQIATIILVIGIILMSFCNALDVSNHTRAASEFHALALSCVYSSLTLIIADCMVYL